MRFDSRLKKAEQSVHGDVLAEVFDCIGQYYDSLDRQQQNRWTQYYYGVEAVYFEQVTDMVSEGDADYHFICERKPPAPSREELEKRIDIVQKYLNDEVGADALDW